jgi:membrane fusion protein (multidrug efflux system)
LTVAQHFVTTGEKRGEQIKVLKGIKEGDVLVTSGQLKLKNDSQVVINNSITLPDNPDPKLKNNHEG